MFKHIKTFVEEGETTKKTVRFAEKTHQRLYRIGSSILDTKKRAIRRRKTAERARERRLSEGDTVEVVNDPQTNGNSIATRTAGPPKAASLDSNNLEQVYFWFFPSKHISPRHYERSFYCISDSLRKLIFLISLLTKTVSFKTTFVNCLLNNYTDTFLIAF